MVGRLPTSTQKTRYIHDGWNVIEEWTADLQSASYSLAKTLTWGTDLSGTLRGAGGVGGLLLITDHSAPATFSHHFHYDGNGNVTELTDSTGATAATYRYDAFGNTLVSTGSYAATNKYRFSTKPIDTEVPNATLYYYGYRYYDPVTGRWPSRDPIGEQGGVNLYGLALTTTSTYDARGNRLTVTDPLNRTTTSQYDLRGNAVKTILPDGRQDMYNYDALNRRTTSTDPKNQTITTGYWYETGQTLTLKDARNNVTTWTLNNLGQILTKAYPNGDTHAYTYDRLHRMATHTTPKNEICTYSYDLRDRKLKADWNTATPDAISTYFANGLLKSIDNGVSKSDYSYSVKNELTAETQTLAGQAGKVVTYSYDADGLRVELNGPGGSPVDYQWTAEARLAGISRDGPPPLATYGYDAAGRLRSTSHENGIVEEKTYNAAGELLANLHKRSGTTASGHAYTYDQTGRRTAETFPGSGTAPRTYGYDAADQVTSASYGNSQTDAYAYDPMGNRTSATLAAMGGSAVAYTANAANQYTAITGQAAPPLHDANGNLTFGNGVTFTWDSENRLLGVSDGTTTNTFTYDGHHRRVTKRTAVGGTVTAKTHFIYDGWNVIGEYVNADTTAGFNLTTFVPGRFLTWGADLSGSLQGAGGVGGLLLVEEISPAATTAHHFHYDGNGNVTGTSDASGAPTATYRYDAFGNTLVSTGSYAATNKYRFSTKPIDAEVSNAPLYYYGYRYYDPATGRWPSRDPIEENGGLNLNGFVGNNGVNKLDYLGMFDLKGCLAACKKGPNAIEKFCHKVPEKRAKCLCFLIVYAGEAACIGYCYAREFDF